MPARSRHIIKPPMLGEKPAPKVNRAKRGRDIIYVAVRPYSSLSGAARTGPKPRPSKKRENGSNATVLETLKVAITSGTAGT